MMRIFKIFIIFFATQSFADTFAPPPAIDQMSFQYKAPQEGTPRALVRFITEDSSRGLGWNSDQIKSLDIPCDRNESGKIIANLNPNADSILEVHKPKNEGMPLNDGLKKNYYTEVYLPANKDLLISLKTLFEDTFSFGLLGVLLPELTRSYCFLYAPMNLENNHVYEFTFGVQNCVLTSSEIIPDGVNGYTKVPYDVAVSNQCKGVTSPLIVKQSPPKNPIGVVSNPLKQGEVWKARITNVPIYDQPNGAAVLRRLNKGEEVVFLGEEQGDFIKVQSTESAGWVKKSLLSKE